MPAMEIHMDKHLNYNNSTCNLCMLRNNIPTWYAHIEIKLF